VSTERTGLLLHVLERLLQYSGQDAHNSTQVHGLIDGRAGTCTGTTVGDLISTCHEIFVRFAHPTIDMVSRTSIFRKTTTAEVQTLS
jgi:hypothetical protein